MGKITKLITRTFCIFLVLYLLTYLFTYLIRKTILQISPEYNKELSDRIFYILNNMFYVFPIVLIVVSITYMKLKEIPYNFLINRSNILAKIVLSFFLVYFSLALLEPISKTFDIKNSESVFNWSNWNGSENLFISVIFLFPFFEELFFRQILLKPFLKDKQTILLGILTTTFLFAIGHFFIINYQFNINYYFFVEMLILGFILSLIRVKFGLLFSILTHLFHNSLALLYQEKVINLYVFDYINNPLLFWIMYLMFATLVVVLIVKITRNLEIDKIK